MDVRSALGICVGASTIKAAEITEREGVLCVGRTLVVNHECNTRRKLLEVLEQFPPERFGWVAVTGRKFKDLVNLPRVTEPEAAEHALRLVTAGHQVRYHGLMSLGSENFILYQLDEEGCITGVRTGNKCASGTGEFFLQQIARMELGVDEACRLAEGAEPYRVSGRCSVFCKSDCTHALNKGIPKGRVCAGLGNMIAEKVLEILGTTPRQNILVVGGVTRNTYVMGRLRAEIQNLIVPPYAEVFEAVGAALYARATGARHAGAVRLQAKGTRFSRLPPLREAAPLVSFREHPRAVAQAGDETILGLDVGSTTTKAVLMRTRDEAILAAVYLRTGGDPVAASRRCYAELDRQLGNTPVRIVALAVTGSGRYIAGLHAQTEAIINEIIAHATAAAYFDKDVDTIFEIGGQDAKYTYLVNGVPCDYAMNEACSAGTGSFIEEAAKESLGVDYRQIQDIALQADAPPNFNDQCAAFISSDIKNASYEMSRENIIAGLVYSICMNYANRVKGARKVGRKVFMQGGVCYNRAVPLAMAALLKQPIVVPPEPGLMGAFGVALEARQRMRSGLLRGGAFDLKTLAAREVSYGKSFVCPGTKEKCDRGCVINVIELEGRKLPFGGICNKYYNALHDLRIDPEPFDYVRRRQEAVFRTTSPEELPARPERGTIGLSRSLLVNLLFPLYWHFFTALGYRVVMADEVSPEGRKRIYSSFCFPAQLAHGMLAAVAAKQPDYIFLPQVKELSVERPATRRPGHQSTCVVVQAEPYYLRSAFPELSDRLLVAELNFSQGWASGEGQFVKLAERLGIQPAEAAAAYRFALGKQEEFFAFRRALGREALDYLAQDPARTGVVLFGRPYNAFAEEANLGIPRKFASRGVPIIPFDCLPFHDEPSQEHMSWAMGQDLIRAARFVKKHPQLFGAFITNFSCGPDSFIIGYFRDIMKTKPSLTLEIDTHTADAGVTTRVEAFLDIVERYRRLGVGDPPEPPFRRAQLEMRNGRSTYVASDGQRYSLKDPRVKVVFPSMGRTLSELASAVFEGLGMRAETVPLPDFDTLMLGRANTTCKECLPLILVAGSLLEYLERNRRNGDLLLYFMPTANGNCRFSQYFVFLNRLIEKKRIENVVTFTLTTENSYGGMGVRAVLRMLKGIVVADAMDDIKNAILALAVDRAQGLAVFEAEWQNLMDCFARGAKDLWRVLRRSAARLATIPLKHPLAEARRVLMAGEIYVRKDEFSSGPVLAALAEREIVVHRAPMLEWIRYIDFWVQHVERGKLAFRDNLELKVRMLLQNRIERKIKRILARSGLFLDEPLDVESIIRTGENFVDRTFGGETILVVGSFFKHVPEHFHGMVNIGPFACLPTRVCEAILTPESQVRGNRHLDALPHAESLQQFATLPFLSIESDGNPFPQIIEARIEAFCLQVERMHRLRQAQAAQASVCRRPEGVRPRIG